MIQNLKNFIPIAVPNFRNNTSVQVYDGWTIQWDYLCKKVIFRVGNDLFLKQFGDKAI
jgi:hypothetical protein